MKSPRIFFKKNSGRCLAGLLFLLLAAKSVAAAEMELLTANHELKRNYQQLASQANSSEAEFNQLKEIAVQYQDQTTQNRLIEAAKKAYQNRNRMLIAYLDWLMPVVQTYADSEAGSQIIQSITIDEESTSTTMPTATTPASQPRIITQQQIYLQQLDQLKDSLSQQLSQVDQVHDQESWAAFRETDTAVMESIEDTFYPIYTFTILSQLRETNYLYGQALEKVQTEVIDQTTNELKKTEIQNQLSQLQQARTILDQEIIDLENSWQQVTSETSYRNFSNQVKQIETRLNQFLQSVRTLYN